MSREKTDDATASLPEQTNHIDHSLDRLHDETVRRLIDGVSVSDRWLIGLSDWFSPILIKEVRQALKSRQFNWTFLLLLFFVAGWTFFAIVSLIPEIYVYPTGPILLLGYVFILVFPVILIVPNAAFQSMASELDHGTFDVISIAPLSSFQIVAGKFAVAMVQTLIYFSAIAPCIALCYLLRGLSLPTIFLSLGWLAVLSILCSSIGIFLASVTRFVSYTTFLSIVNILISIVVLIGLLIAFGESLFDFSSIDWITAGIMLTVWVFILMYAVVTLLAAAAVIGIVGENYSTVIRRWLLAIPCFAFTTVYGFSWTTGQISNWFDDKTSIPLLCGLGVHLASAGMFLIAERVVASPRALRSFPATLLGRMTLSWMNPGSGTGYIFVLASFSGFWIGSSISTYRFCSTDDFINVLLYGSAILSYLAFYLGITRLILLILPLSTGTRFLVSFCCTSLTLLLGTLAPMVIWILLHGSGATSFEWYFVMNPFWTLSEERYVQQGGMVFLVVSALVIFVLNFATLSRDIVIARVESPPRRGLAGNS